MIVVLVTSMPSISIGGISLLYPRLSIHIYTYKIYLYLSSISLFVLTFQVHCMWTYIDPIFGTTRLHAVNAMENPLRMQFVKGCHKRMLSRLPRTLSQTRRYMHLRPLH